MCYPGKQPCDEAHHEAACSQWQCLENGAVAVKNVFILIREKYNDHLEMCRSWIRKLGIRLLAELTG